MPSTSPLPLAALLMPILALIVISAVDSVQEDDSPYYRIFVAGMGLASVGPIGVVVLLGILSSVGDISATDVVLPSLISVTLILILIMGITVYETTRGIEAEKDGTIYLLGLLLVVVWYGVLFLVF